MAKQVFTTRFIQVVLYVALALVFLWAAVTILRPVDTVSAAGSPAPNSPTVTSFLCNPTGSAAFPNRVHVRCSNSPGSGITYFAAANTDSALASRYLSLITSAVIAGKSIWVWYDPAGDGSSFSCGTSDCRPILGLALNQ